VHGGANYEDRIVVNQPIADGRAVSSIASARFEKKW